MKFFTHNPLAKKLSLIGATAVLVIVGSLLQTKILKVRADVNVLLVSNTAIPFGNIFPGETLDKTYSVALDTSVNNATYMTTLAPVSGQQNLCPFLQVSSQDTPAEPDTLPSAALTRPSDITDNWQVRLLTPGIRGQISQDHQGQIIVSGGDYSCQISITTDTQPPPPPQGAQISGMKFNDLNRNGKKDPGEPGLAGWTIRLRGPKGNIVKTTVTDANGNYAFTGLTAGKYKVREVHQKGWKRMTKNPKQFTLESNGGVNNINFGNAVKHNGEKEDTDNDDERDD